MRRLSALAALVLLAGCTVGGEGWRAAAGLDPQDSCALARLLRAPCP